jgi:dGTPase
MEWKNLLSTVKLVSDEGEPECFRSYPINDIEKDYNKIVSNAAFRRLQDKTQVFPLDKSDFVRTRLTHSIEVSTIARQLGIMITKNETQYKPKDINGSEAEKIASILLCAGLLHDLGNPPFGHFGETVIGDWFKEKIDCIQYKGSPLASWLSPQMVADLKNFEGNAQALRILLKSKYNSNINLSFSVISTLVKYPTNSLSVEKGSRDIRKHKMGYFLAEEETFKHISEKVGTLQKSEIYRHPLTFVLEAADDIAYATADLEDAFKKGLFTIKDFTDYYKNSYEPAKVKEHNSPEYYSDNLINDLVERYQKNPSGQSFIKWLNSVRRWFMYVAVYRFSYKYKEIINGTYSGDLFEETYHSLSIKILKNAMKEFAYDTSGILKLELSAQTILSFLLEKFVHAVLYYDYQDEANRYIPSKADKKYICLLPENYKADYNEAKTGDESFDLYLRLLMVTDYISGMTDSYARNLYRELSGIE